MAQNVDQELASMLDHSNVVPSTKATSKFSRSKGIDSNPLYASYENTDLSLWQTRDGRVKKKKLTQKRTILKKPILQQLKNKTSSETKDWLQSNMNELVDITTWSQRKGSDKATKSKPVAYNMNEMEKECDQVMSEMDDMPGSSENQVSELISYFDDIVHIPKKMSAMAESMYS
ncbi:hypothetical protein KR093_010046 [Drosophila rubida]|uniref:Peroxide-inducible transcript 1 protein n=1 Tax=Drosophila rubida TaxID=30044 RepID=A0AAD4K475_9MUSC|nr:hypothetical protein KR093_010046 [Drosophila rubida]